MAEDTFEFPVLVLPKGLGPSDIQTLSRVAEVLATDRVLRPGLQQHGIITALDSARVMLSTPTARGSKYRTSIELAAVAIIEAGAIAEAAEISADPMRRVEPLLQQSGTE